ncbi:hypothetical protein P3S67_003049 [Capsicum chacoense]
MQQEVASLVCPLPVLKSLMATLDASAFEIPSPSMESFDMAEEERQLSSPPTCSKLSLVAPVVVPSYAMAKKYDPGTLVEDPMEAFDGDLGVDIIDKENEDDILDECSAKVITDGDLSPRQQRKEFKIMKTHERKHSWDGKVSEGVIPKQLSITVAKQKETRFNCINKIQ